MSVQEVATDIATLVPSSVETIWSQIGSGSAVVTVRLLDMAPGDQLMIRQTVVLNTDIVIAASHLIEAGTTTDETWVSTAQAGDADASAWTSWNLVWGDLGGDLTLESLSGSYDVEFTVVSTGGPTD